MADICGISSQKARLVADMVRGKKVDEALITAPVYAEKRAGGSSTRRSARPWRTLKILMPAICDSSTSRPFMSTRAPGSSAFDRAPWGGPRALLSLESHNGRFRGEEIKTPRERDAIGLCSSRRVIVTVLKSPSMEVKFGTESSSNRVPARHL